MQNFPLEPYLSPPKTQSDPKPNGKHPRHRDRVMAVNRAWCDAAEAVGSGCVPSRRCVWNSCGAVVFGDDDQLTAHFFGGSVKLIDFFERMCYNAYIQMMFTSL